MALKTLYDKDIGIKTEKLKALADLVRDIAKVAVPSNRPIVGDDLFRVESGIIANWLLNCGEEHQTELFPFRPRMVGQKEPEIVIGKGSGIDSIKDRLARFQLQADEKKAMDVLLAVKDWGLKYKRLMSDDEFRKLAEGVLA
jgi:isopropylmalate/homocitrate/citramalate synthase